jgi:hypothetical protein
MARDNGTTPDTGVWIYPDDNPTGREATPAEANQILGMDNDRSDASIIRAWRQQHGISRH